jgi:hypothetical protein
MKEYGVGELYFALKDKRTSKNAMMTGDPADILPSNFS